MTIYLIFKFHNINYFFSIIFFYWFPCVAREASLVHNNNKQTVFNCSYVNRWMHIIINVTQNSLYALMTFYWLNIKLWVIIFKLLIWFIFATWYDLKFEIEIGSQILSSPHIWCQFEYLSRVSITIVKVFCNLILN